jgi:hypothetical protein
VAGVDRQDVLFLCFPSSNALKLRMTGNCAGALIEPFMIFSFLRAVEAAGSMCGENSGASQ